MTYTSKYIINGKQHTWETINPIANLDENGYIRISDKLQKIYKTLLEMLEFLNDITKQHNITYFAMSGTLLGACRNGGIIPNDDDIDVGIPIKHYAKLKWLCTQDLHPKFHFQVTESCGIRIYQNIGKKMPFIDIFIMAEFEGKYKYAGPFYKDEPTFYMCRTFDKEWIDAEDIETTTTVPFENQTIKIPKNADKWLRRVYGDDCYVRYVPDMRVPFLHELVDIIPLYELEQTICLICNDILKLDNRAMPVDAQVVNVIAQTIFFPPVDLNQMPQKLVQRNLQTIQRFIKARMEMRKM
jgi:phosphorylcholine metabolism protein LicD